MGCNCRDTAKKQRLVEQRRKEYYKRMRELEKKSNYKPRKPSENSLPQPILEVPSNLPVQTVY